MVGHVVLLGYLVVIASTGDALLNDSDSLFLDRLLAFAHKIFSFRNEVCQLMLIIRLNPCFKGESAGNSVFGTDGKHGNAAFKIFLYGLDLHLIGVVRQMLPGPQSLKALLFIPENPFSECYAAHMKIFSCLGNRNTLIEI